MEQRNIHMARVLGNTGDMRVRRSLFVEGQVVPDYFCPSHRAPEKTRRTGRTTRYYKEYDQRIAHGTFWVGKNDYAACCLANYSISVTHEIMAAVYNNSSARFRAGFINLPGGPGVVIHAWKYPRNWSNNKSIRDIKVDHAGLRDGSAHTFIAGEKRHNNRGVGGNTGGDNEGYAVGWDWDVLRYGDQMPMPNVNISGRVRFGSSHPGGVNFVFADGSVHTVPYSVDGIVFARMGHRADGVPFDVPW
jgi:prepilin-type processing-associated H-X9-DG protein